jgi:hypothetical protein
MKNNAIVVAGIIFVLLAVAVFVFVSSQSPFPAFHYSTQSDHFINVNANIGPDDSGFMWTNYDLTLVAQAFVLFGAAAASLAMLKTDEKEDSE